MIKPYIIQSATLITYNGRKVPLEIIDHDIISKPVKIVKEQIEIERLKSLLTDGDPIGCHVDGRSVIGDKRPLSFEIVCESDSIAQICAKILNDGFLTVEQAKKYFKV